MTLKQQLLTNADRPLLGRTERRTICACSLCYKLWGYSLSESSWEVFVCYSLVCFKRHKPLCPLKLGVSGTHPSGGSLKSWGAWCAPWGGAGSWEFPLNCMVLPRVGFSKCVSAFPSCFNVGDVGIGFAQLFSGFLLEGVALCLAEDLLCPWKEMNSGGSCLSILDPILPKAGF